MKKRWKDFAKAKISFRRRLLISFITVSVTPLIIIGIFSLIQAEQKTYSEKEKIYLNNMEQTYQTIETKVTSINRASELLIFNTGIIEMFEQDFRDKSDFQKYALFRDIFNPAIRYTSVIAPDITNVTFYTTAAIKGYRQDISPLDKNVPKRIKEFRLSNTPEWVLENNILYVINEIPSTFSRTDRTIIEFKLNYQDFFSDVISSDDNFNVVISDKNRTIFTNQNQDKQAEHPIEATFSKEFHHNNWVLHYHVLKSPIDDQTQSIIMSVIALLIGSVLIAFLMTQFFTTHILKTLDELKNKVKKVTNKDLTVDFSSTHHDEFGELSNLIGEMLDSIKTLIDKNYNATIEKQDSQYQALVSQINSHFLYNSLSMINWKAIMSENLEISHIVQTLSTFYRTTLNHGRTPITLEEEIENAQAYINLQLFLDPNQFNIIYDFQIAHDNLFVINLLLQPLIENAIEHGFKEKPPNATIQIITKKDIEGNLILAVTDNGHGMTNDELNSVLSEDYSGYGLKNINKRLQFYFGKKYGLTIHSVEGKGTTVIMKLPVLTSLDEIDQLDTHERI